MKNHSLVIAVITFLSMASAADAKYSGGTGEPNDPYRIATATDLNDVGNYEEDWDKHFILVNDVNLAQYTDTQFKIIGNDEKRFVGVFDGNDHKILNFTWSSTGRNYIGLFGFIGSGQIKNLGLENVNVDTVGYYVGGLVGRNTGTITNCYSTGSVSGTGGVGGFAGGNDGTITNSYSTGSVSGDHEVGGLAGRNRYNGMITNCYSTGSVIGVSCVGGLVGFIGACFQRDSMIIGCYSTGSVSGISDVGGLVGLEGDGTIMDSFWDTETSGQLTSAGGEPKTTAEMKKIRTFADAGWDFVEIWGIAENQTYPFLRTEPAGDLNYDKKVDLFDLAILAMHWLAQNNP